MNQRDNGEKEAQVQLMRRIYKTAYLIMADLGEAGDEYDDVVAMFNALVHITRTTANYEQISNERYEIVGLPAYEDRKWESWRDFWHVLGFVACGSCRSMQLHHISTWCMVLCNYTAKHSQF